MIIEENGIEKNTKDLLKSESEPKRNEKTSKAVAKRGHRLNANY